MLALPGCNIADPLSPGSQLSRNVRRGHHMQVFLYDPAIRDDRPVAKSNLRQNAPAREAFADWAQSVQLAPPPKEWARGQRYEFEELGGQRTIVLFHADGSPLCRIEDKYYRHDPAARSKAHAFMVELPAPQEPAKP